MNRNFLSNFWENPKYILYTKIIGAFASGCTCIVFLNSNQIQYLKDRNEDLGKTYELNRELDRKKCESEQTEMRINIEMSLNSSYRKLKQGSKEAVLFMEAYQNIHGGANK